VDVGDPGATCQLRKHRALASADDGSHDQSVIARANGGPGSASPVAVANPQRTRAGSRTHCTTLARSARTASRPAGSFSRPASRPVITVHARIRQAPTRKKPHLWNIGPVITGLMFHRAGCCGSHWPHGPRRPLSSRPEDAANHQEDGPGTSGTWPYFDGAGAGFRASPAHPYCIQVSAAPIPPGKTSNRTAVADQEVKRLRIRR